MPTDRWLQHISLNTDYARRSYRSEVSETAVCVCRDLLQELRDGDDTIRAQIPGMPYDLCDLRESAKGAQMVIYERGTFDPLVHIGIASHSQAGARIWRDMHRYAEEWCLPVATDPEQCPAEPWCATLKDSATVYAMPHDLQAVDELVRCLAWAWLERLGRS